MDEPLDFRLGEIKHLLQIGAQEPPVTGLTDLAGSSGGVVRYARQLSAGDTEICLRELANRLEDAIRKGHPTAQALTEYLSAGVAQNNRRAA